jgi:hypothetical protein
MKVGLISYPPLPRLWSFGASKLICYQRVFIHLSGELISVNFLELGQASTSRPNRKEFPAGTIDTGLNSIVRYILVPRLIQSRASENSMQGMRAGCEQRWRSAEVEGLCYLSHDSLDRSLTYEMKPSKSLSSPSPTLNLAQRFENAAETIVRRQRQRS